MNVTTAPATLTAANRQWASRPADERYTDLYSMLNHFSTQRRNSAEKIVASRDVQFIPAADHRGLSVRGKANTEFAPTHFAFGQVASLVGAPAGYLRTLPAELAADALNYGLQIGRDVKDIGLLLQRDGTLRAATGPRYGRIWNADIVRGLVDTFGDGITGDWKVPGEFGKDVVVTKANTTLFAGDRDMFVFLADEKNRIELPNRRDGKTGTLARGFFVWNSEVGSTTFGVSTFLFDYVCCNRLVWGPEEVKQITLRHTASAPAKFLEQIAPALQTYANGSASSLLDGIEKARAARLDDVDQFIQNRFGRGQIAPLKAIHELEEGRPIESLWDLATAVTAQARSIEWQDERVAAEREAGKLIKLAA